MSREPLRDRRNRPTTGMISGANYITRPGAAILAEGGTGPLRNTCMRGARVTHTIHPVGGADKTPRPTSVYRYYDVNDLLVYVGITSTGVSRNLQHSRRAEWWPFVARQELEHYPSRQVAERRERELIRQHRPPFNKQHNIDSAELRASYLSLVSSGASEESADDIVHRLNRKVPLRGVDDDGTLSTYVAHFAVARALVLDRERPPLIRSAKHGHLSHVTAVAKQGAVALLKPKRPVRGVVTAYAVAGWAGGGASGGIRFKRIVVCLADEDPSEVLASESGAR